MKYILPVLITLSFFRLSAQSPYIVDESYTDASFFEFKTKLTTAVLKRDRATLFPMFADSVRANYDDLVSRKYFIENYGLRDTGDDSDWEQLELLVRYGFSRVTISDTIEARSWYGHPVKGTVFSAPSYDQHLIYDSTVIILGRNVNVREKPSKDAKIIHTVSYEILNVAESGEDHIRHYHAYNEDEQSFWVCVIVDGKKGYINYQYTSDFISKHLVIHKINGQWKIVAFFHWPSC